jgi:hypothetical protein
MTMIYGFQISRWTTETLPDLKAELVLQLTQEIDSQPAIIKGMNISTVT